MLCNFFASTKLQRSYQLTLSYRYSREYRDGFNRRNVGCIKAYPLHLPDPACVEFIIPNLPAGLRRCVYLFFRAGFSQIFALYDIARLFMFFKKIRPAIVHINNGGYPGAISCRAAAISAKLSGVDNIIMVVNNRAVPYTSLWRWLDFPMDWAVKKSVKQFVTGSNAAAEQLRVVLGLCERRARSFNNGISPRASMEEYSETRLRLGLDSYSGLVFGIVAVMEARKGHLILLKAIEILQTEGVINIDNFRLLIEGDGLLRGELEAYVRKNNLKNYVFFVGNENNIFDFMKVLDCVVAPSIADEDFPNVVLESMYLGKIVVASKLAGIPEQIIDGVSGLLVDPGDPHDLARALALTISNPERMKILAAAAQERFNAEFTADIAVDRYLKLYDGLLRDMECSVAS